MRTEKVVTKEASDSKIKKDTSNHKYTKEELENMIIRLAEAHGLITDEGE